MRINVTMSSIPSFEEYCDEIKDIWNTYHLTNQGPKHKFLETKLNDFLQVSNTILFTNGHLALENVISAFGFKPGSEVITTPFTFVSTTSSIVRCGLVPIFCDINKNDYTIDTKQIEKLITKKTVAIVAVHVYGNICDVEEIERIAKKHNLKVIYDAAHAFGVKYKNKGIASFGDAAMFSFHATKVFNSIEGGCACFKDEQLVNKLNSQKNFGLVSEEECDYIAGNAKMNEFQACMGICNLRHIDEYIKGRKFVVEHYLKRLNNVPGIRICKPQLFVEPNYAYFPVVFDGYKYSRDEIKEMLAKNDIGARKYFYPLTCNFSAYKKFNKNNTPLADYISQRVLTLPLYPTLDIKDVDLICDIILNGNKENK